VFVGASIAFGRAQPVAAQLAFSYDMISPRETRTVLMDVRHPLTYRLRRGGVPVSLVGWVDADKLMVVLEVHPFRPALFQLGRGWIDDPDCPPPGCQLIEHIASASPDWLGDNDFGVRWSVDGEYAAFMRRAGSGYALRLYVADAAGRTLRLTRGVFDLAYAWRP
jgi:hypothetical protein